MRTAGRDVVEHAQAAATGAVAARERRVDEVDRALDRGFNAIVGAESLDDFAEPEVDRLWAWPEAVAALRSGLLGSAVTEEAIARRTRSRPINGRTRSRGTAASSTSRTAPSETT